MIDSYYEGCLIEKKVHTRASDLASIPEHPLLGNRRMNVKSRKQPLRSATFRNPQFQFVMWSPCLTETFGEEVRNLFLVMLRLSVVG